VQLFGLEMQKLETAVLRYGGITKIAGLVKENVDRSGIEKLAWL
jgi:hypothetical protein